eukprot:343930-Heterocapsa_arctica.AAC.1
MEDYPQDIIDKFNQVQGNTRSNFKQILTMEGVEITGPIMAWRKLPTPGQTLRIKTTNHIAIQLPPTIHATQPHSG